MLVKTILPIVKAVFIFYFILNDKTTSYYACSAYNCDVTIIHANNPVGI